MISNEDIAFLISVKGHGGRIRKDALDQESAERASNLQEEGLMQYSFYRQNEDGSKAISSFWITTKGYDAISAYEKRQQEKEDQQQAQRQADFQAAQDRRKQRHHDYLVGAFGALIGAIVTFLLQHVQDIENAAIKVFNLFR